MNLLNRWKTASETPETGAATVSLRFSDLAVLTYRVPEARVLKLLPSGFAPDILPDENGERCAFVQTTAAFCEEARWSIAPEGSGESYREITYRVLGRVDKGKPGAYLLRTFYTGDAVYLAQRAVQKNADFARASVHISGDPVRGEFAGYGLRTTADRGTTEWELVPQTETAAPQSPFGSVTDMAHFLLRRETLVFAPSAAPQGFLGIAPLRLPDELPPATLAALVSARLTPWREWGVLNAEEANVPQSVLYLSSVTATAYAPRLRRLS